MGWGRSASGYSTGGDGNATEPFWGMWARGIPRRLDSRVTPQGLDRRSKMEEVVPKMARRRSSDPGQSKRRRRCTLVSVGWSIIPESFLRWTYKE